MSSHQAEPTKEDHRVLLIIPCYNEAQVLPGLLEEIKKVDGNFDTLVVDDGSIDNTYLVASERSTTIRLAENLGIGAAIHTGIRYAQNNGYQVCIQVDGDGQHPPNQLTELLEAFRGQSANIIIGSRYLKESNFRSTFMRRLGSQIIGAMLFFLFGQRISDPTSGMRLFDRRTIEFFYNNYPHDYPEPISLARAFQNGLSAREVPVEMRERRHGSSSIVGFKTILYMIRALSYILIIRLGPRA